MSAIQNRNLLGIVGPPAGVGVSRSFGGMWIADNAVTTVVDPNVFTDMNLNASAALAFNSVNWVLTDTTNGELTYQGTAPFSGFIYAAVTVESVDFTPNTVLRVVKNGIPVADDAQSQSEINISGREFSFISPISVVNGDTIKLEIKTTSGVDIVVVHATCICRLA